VTLKNNVVEPPLDVHTEWVENEYGKHLEFHCECGNIERMVRRSSTKFCSSCDRLMQADNYSCSGKAPDPQNPKRFLRATAKRRGLPYDYYYPDEDEPTADDPLDF